MSYPSRWRLTFSRRGEMDMDTTSFASVEMSVYIGA